MTRFLYAFSVLALILISCDITTSHDASDTTICDLDPNHNITVNLLGTFIFDNQLYLLTKDWFVYEVPRETLEMGYDQLLVKDAAMKIEHKWLAFENEIFQTRKNRIAMMFSFNSAKKPQILLLTSKVDEHGLLYNIKDRTLEERFTNKKNEKQIVISNLEDDYMWGIKIDADHQSLQKWTVKYNPDGTVNAFNDEDKLLYLFVDEQSKYIALYDESKPADLPQGYHPLNESFMAGFVWDKKFYLFTSNHIHIFEVQLTQDLKKSVELKVVSTNDYLKCKVEDLASSGITFGVILAFALPILIIVLLIVLFLRKTSNKKHHKHHKEKGREEQQASAMSSKAASARSSSTSNMQPGKLEPNVQSKTVASKASQSRVPSIVATNRSGMDPSIGGNAISRQSMMPSNVATNRSGLSSTNMPTNIKQSKLSNRSMPASRSMANSQVPTNRSGILP